MMMIGTTLCSGPFGLSFLCRTQNLPPELGVTNAQEPTLANFHLRNSILNIFLLILQS